MCDYPPSTAAGAPIIVKQLLSQYDPSRLHVLCCERQYSNSSALVRESYLSCSHTVVRSYQKFDLRPRRVFVPITLSIDCCRLPRIMAAGRQIIERHGIRAIFTVPWHCEFALAALLLHQQTGIPLYVFETDDWEQMNPKLVPNHLIRKHHEELLTSASKVWLTSPAMVRRYREKFRVDGEFLFHFVDPDKYRGSSNGRAERRPDGTIEIVYTGAINEMFYDTMAKLCSMMNAGLVVAGAQVKLNIYSARCPEEFLGPHVAWRGFVKSEDIPEVLAAYDIALVSVSFRQDPRILDLVKTSLYTKTIDYLAAGIPVLVVSPSYSGEVDYFGDVTTVVTSPDEAPVKAALESLAARSAEVQRKCELGTRLVRDRHSLHSLRSVFLHHFAEV
jgi:hypothetical protein